MVLKMLLEETQEHRLVVFAGLWVTDSVSLVGIDLKINEKYNISIIITGKLQGQENTNICAMVLASRASEFLFGHPNP